jgi:hypothetical protein
MPASASFKKFNDLFFGESLLHRPFPFRVGLFTFWSDACIAEKTHGVTELNLSRIFGYDQLTGAQP